MSAKLSCFVKWQKKFLKYPFTSIKTKVLLAEFYLHYYALDSLQCCVPEQNSQQIRPLFYCVTYMSKQCLLRSSEQFDKCYVVISQQTLGDKWQFSHIQLISHHMSLKPQHRWNGRNSIYHIHLTYSPRD